MNSEVTDNVLSVEELTAGYGGTVVLDQVSLVVERGQTVALLGPNGAGKTTLLRAITGVVKPRTGVVRLNGEVVTGGPPFRLTRKGVCYLPEGRSIFPSLNVRDNLIIESPRGQKRTTAIDMAVEAFPVLGMRLKQMAGSLSGGEQQMLTLARALMTKPQLVIVDEASLGLAPVIVDQIFAFLQELVASGVSVLLVEQYFDRAVALADQVYLLKRGRIVFSSPSAEVKWNDVFEQYLGTEIEVALEAG